MIGDRTRALTVEAVGLHEPVVATVERPGPELIHLRI
jgi:hypothetical protein